MRDHGPATAQEIAVGIGGEAKRLHFHLNQMVEMKLLIISELNRGRGKPQPVYSTVANKYLLDKTNLSEEYMGAMKGSVGAMLRMANRELSQALQENPKATYTVFRQSISLNPEDLEQVLRRISEIEAFVRGLHAPEAPETYSLTLLLTPTK